MQASPQQIPAGHDDPAAVVREVFHDAFRGRLDAVDPHPGLRMLREHIPALQRAFSDFSAELQQQLVDGDRVASHWVFRGTHDGPLYGIAPSGKHLQFQNLSICRVEDGKIVQYNSEVGFLRVLLELGVLPLKGDGSGAATTA